jgi:hypothetical protein
MNHDPETENHAKHFANSSRTPPLRNGSTTKLDDLACKGSASSRYHRSVGIPLIHSPSSLAKKATTRPISWGTATLFNGQMLASPASILSKGIPLYPNGLDVNTIWPEALQICHNSPALRRVRPRRETTGDMPETKEEIHTSWGIVPRVPGVQVSSLAKYSVLRPDSLIKHISLHATRGNAVNCNALRTTVNRERADETLYRSLATSIEGVVWNSGHCVIM